MGERSSRRTGNSDFYYIALASVLPIAGYFLLEWSFAALVLLFWLEAVTVILFYGGLAMVITPENEAEARERSRRSDRSIRIRSENLKAILPKTGLGLLIAVSTGGGISVWGVGRRAGRESDESVLDFFAQFTVFADPSVFVVGLVIVSVHLLTLSRYYFGTGRHRELTVEMALDVQMKYYGSYFLFSLTFVFYAVAMFFVVGLSLDGVVSDTTGVLVWQVVVAGSFLPLKLAFERSRFRGERRPGLDDGSFTANFSPTPSSAKNTK